MNLKPEKNTNSETVSCARAGELPRRGFIKSLGLAGGAMFCGKASSASERKDVAEKPSANVAPSVSVPPALSRAMWILPRESADILNYYALYRAPFELSEVPQTAPLFITADQCYRLYINGKFVCSGPARGYQRSWPYDELDAAKFLKAGKNLIAVRIYNAGRGNFGYIHEGAAGLLFALSLGGGREILSKPNMKMRRQRGCDRNTAKISDPLNMQEHIDLREENPRWKEIDFDDAAWDTGFGRVYNAPPYYSMEPRMTPMLEEFEIFPKALVSRGEGRALTLDERMFDCAKLFSDEKIPHVPVSGGGLYCVAKPSEGNVGSFVFDFGKMTVGMPILKIEGAKGGEIIDVLTTEIIENGDASVSCGSNLAPANRLICREGTQEHIFFQIFGARYMAVRVRNNPNSELKIKPSLMWSAYPLADRGKFETSNPYVNKLWRACRHTQKVCTLDSYVDTPYREQAQWWGDARVQAWNTFFISGDVRPLRRGIRSIAMQKTPDGLTYGEAPTSNYGCVLTDYSLIWILTVWDYYWQTGDIGPFLENKETVDSIFAYFDSFTEKRTGLVSFDARYWLFLDWCKIQKKGQPAVLNLWLLNALDNSARLCRENGLSADAERYGQKAAKLRAAIIKNLLKPDGLMSDGIDENGAQNPATSIHSQTLAKINNIEGFDFNKALREILLPLLSRKKKLNTDPTAYWTVYVLRVLVDAGYEREAYDYIKKMWKDSAEYGSAYEDFVITGTNTHSHAWSAHPSFLLPQILSGVRQEAAGWKKVSYRPNFFEDSADIVFPTPLGDVAVSYKKNADGSYSEKFSAPKSVETSRR